MNGTLPFALSKIKRESIVLSKEQKASIVSVFSGQDTVVCLPTGHGKSIVFEALPWCHQFPNEAGSEYSVIVSPLLSLMDKQVEDLTQRGLSAVRLSNDLPPVVEDAVKTAQITYLFASPEILQDGKWRGLLLAVEYQTRLKAVFVDEAHCMEMWGSGNRPFRQSYRQLGDLRSFLPNNVPFCALTATASNETRKYIIDSLGLVNVVTISLSPNRNNIMYHVQRTSNDIAISFGWIIEELRGKKTCTPKKVIYCRSIEACAKLYCLFDMTLQKGGYVGPHQNVSSCLFAMYHAKITDEQKKTILKSFANPLGNCQVLFATIAFGMGVNIPDIRMVIHHGPSHNVEEYVQECGRGGRDGMQCHAVLYTYSGCTRGLMSDNMKNYCKEDNVCCRHTLFKLFPGVLISPPVLHDCCDVCQSQCLCACKCHCTCGKGTPCNECCQCSSRCDYVSILPTETKVVADKDGDEDDDPTDSDLMWDEESYFHTK